MQAEQPEKAALIAFDAMLHVSKTEDYRAFKELLQKAIGEAITEKIFSAQLSPTLSAMAFCETLALSLGRGISVVAELLAFCPLVEKEDENYRDLFRRAVADLLLEGANPALREAMLNFLVDSNEEKRKLDLKE